MVESGPVTERILSAILPVLCRGLKSGLADYKAGSYGILCKVLVKATLKTSLVETLMNAVCKVRRVRHSFPPTHTALKYFFYWIFVFWMQRHTQRRVRLSVCSHFPACTWVCSLLSRHAGPCALTPGAWSYHVTQVTAAVIVGRIVAEGLHRLISWR